jgi:hypothetical protein
VAEAVIRKAVRPRDNLADLSNVALGELVRGLSNELCVLTALFRIGPSGSEEGASVDGVVALHGSTMQFDSVIWNAGLAAPGAQYLRVAPDFEVVDPPRIDGVRRDREIDAPVECARPVYQITVRIDVSVTMGFVDEQVTSDDDHSFSQIPFGSWHLPPV